MYIYIIIIIVSRTTKQITSPLHRRGTDAKCPCLAAPQVPSTSRCRSPAGGWAILRVSPWVAGIMVLSPEEDVPSGNDEQFAIENWPFIVFIVDFPIGNGHFQ